jgi:hypothetical protein
MMKQLFETHTIGSFSRDLPVQICFNGMDAASIIARLQREIEERGNFVVIVAPDYEDAADGTFNCYSE